MDKNINTIPNNKCTGCGACQMVCPAECIIMKRDKEGFLYPEINEKECLSCGICSKVCTNEKNRNNVIKESECYAAYAHKMEDRMLGSSGGVFSLLAKEVLMQKGVVFGAAFNENFDVEHKVVNRIEELSLICGSKYIQSNIGECFKQIRQELLNNRLVLFCGTPCQVTGLCNYLGDKKYDNLICTSLICHGVPSVTVWKSFLSDIESDFNLNKKDIIEIRFRKKYGNKQFFEIQTKTQTVTWNYTDISFVHGFLKNYYLRPSCYECREKDMYSAADIIIGDFWGIDKLSPELSNINAVSACILLTEKGKKLFNRIKGLVKTPFSYEEIMSGNEALIKSSKIKPSIREYFYKCFCEDKKTFSESLALTNRYDIIERNKSKQKICKMPKRFNNASEYQFVLWGLGSCFEQNRISVQKMIHVSYVCDNNEMNWEKDFYGLRCIKPEEVSRINNPFVIIMIENAGIGFSVANQLLDMGITNFDLYSNWMLYADTFGRR